MIRLMLLLDEWRFLWKKKISIKHGGFIVPQWSSQSRVVTTTNGLTISSAWSNIVYCCYVMTLGQDAVIVALLRRTSIGGWNAAQDNTADWSLLQFTCSEDVPSFHFHILLFCELVLRVERCSSAGWGDETNHRRLLGKVDTAQVFRARICPGVILWEGNEKERT